MGVLGWPGAVSERILDHCMGGWGGPAPTRFNLTNTLVQATDKNPGPSKSTERVHRFPLSGQRQLYCTIVPPQLRSPSSSELPGPARGNEASEDQRTHSTFRTGSRALCTARSLYSLPREHAAGHDPAQAGLRQMQKLPRPRRCEQHVMRIQRRPASQSDFRMESWKSVPSAQPHAQSLPMISRPCSTACTSYVTTLHPRTLGARLAGPPGGQKHRPETLACAASPKSNSLDWDCSPLETSNSCCKHVL